MSIKRLALGIVLALTVVAAGFTQGTTVGDRYPGVARIQVTTAQDLALQIEFKTLKNDNRTATNSPEEYLADRVLAIFQDLEVAHAKVTSPEVKAKADEALKQATPQQEADYKAAMQSIFGVDLDPKVPAGKDAK